MSDQHEESRAAFEAALYCENVQRLDAHMGLYQHPFTQWRWEGWKLALDYAASRECGSVWHLSRGAEENPDDGTIVGECSGGQFVVFAPSKIPIYCPGCGGRVKIVQQTDEEQ